MGTITAPAIPEYDNSRRDNAEVKAAIALIIERKEQALRKALALVKEADKALFYCSEDREDTMYDKAQSEIWGAEREISRALDFNFSNDTYLGNKAVGPMGAAVLRSLEMAKNKS